MDKPMISVALLDLLATLEENGASEPKLKITCDKSTFDVTQCAGLLIPNSKGTLEGLGFKID